MNLYSSYAISPVRIVTRLDFKLSWLIVTSDMLIQPGSLLSKNQSGGNFSEVPIHMPLLSTCVNRTMCAGLPFRSPSPVQGEGCEGLKLTEGWRGISSFSMLDQCRTQFDDTAKCCGYKVVNNAQTLCKLQHD